MPERTQLSQEDEHLRRTQRDDRIRAGLQWIAQRLDSWRPTDAMTTNARDMAARRYVNDRWSADPATAEAVYSDLLRALPHIREHDSRDAYAARVRLIVEGAAA